MHLCLSPPQAFDCYRKQVETTGDGEQVLCLLLCCARAVHTGAQGRDLTQHIERRLGKANSGDDEEVRSFLRILRGYILHQAGQEALDSQGVVRQSVDFLMNNCCAAEAKTQRRKPYVIDTPNLMLLCYGMTICGINRELRWKTLLGFYVSRLSEPGNEAACESALTKRLNWCRDKLGSSAARDFPLEVLAIPCHDVDSGSLMKAIAYVFSFLLSQYVKEPDAVDAVSRAVNEGLRLSVCDVLYTLSALILVGVPPMPLLDHDRLCKSPVGLMEEAWQRAGSVAEKLPTHHLLVFFIETYGNLTFPTAYSFQKNKFMHQICGRSEALILSLVKSAETQNEGVEFLNEDMLYADDEDS